MAGILHFFQLYWLIGKHVNSMVQTLKITWFELGVLSFGVLKPNKRVKYN